jgi:hypothetical protein
MWIEAVAIALPRVQRHFDSTSPTCFALVLPHHQAHLPRSLFFFVTVADGKIGVLPASMHAGMMFGAVGWGACACLFSAMPSTPIFSLSLVCTFFG